MSVVAVVQHCCVITLNFCMFLFNLRLKIVDDDIDWRHLVTEQTEIEEDEEEDPVVSS